MTRLFALARAFAGFAGLANLERMLVRRDFGCLVEEVTKQKGIPLDAAVPVAVSIYVKRIGKGNIVPYARTLRAQWDKLKGTPNAPEDV